MSTHYLSILNPEECPTFDYIKNGIKTVEGRKNSKKYQKYSIGDTLIFTYKVQEVKTKILYINRYKTVKDYLEKETLKNALPNIKTIEDGINIYNLWTSVEEREKLREKYDYSFLGIGIQLDK